MPVPNGNLFDTASAYGMLQQLDGGQAACAINGPSETERGEAGTTTHGNVLNFGGVGARGAKVSFQYLLVVQHP
jgi:hypothetical protein